MKEESPDDSKVAIECGSGIVLEENSWKVLGYSLPWIPKCDRVVQKSIIDVYIKLIGEVKLIGTM